MPKTKPLQPAGRFRVNKFNVGDRVRVIRRASYFYGAECCITSSLALRLIRCVATGREATEYVYRVDLKPVMGLPWVGFPPRDLQLIRDDFQASSWEQVEKDTGWSPLRDSVYIYGYAND